MFRDSQVRELTFLNKRIKFSMTGVQRAEDRDVQGKTTAEAGRIKVFGLL